MRRVLLLAVALTAVPAHGMLTIDVNYVTPVSPAVEAVFDNAASTWETLLQGYQDGLVVARTGGSSFLVGQTVDTVFIDANISPIDGPGGVLGSAGPNEVALDAAGFILATDGVMTFDDADVANQITAGTFNALILHEMAHVLGFGTLWTNNNVYVTNSGEYLGVNATAAWQTEYGQIGTPDVELAGGPGTANGHWNEVDNDPGNGLSPLQPTGITDPLGRDLRDELMTGFLTAPTTPDLYISQMTVNSFIDIGFIGSIVGVPEAGSFLTMGLVFFGGAAAGRRRTQ